MPKAKKEFKKRLEICRKEPHDKGNPDFRITKEEMLDALSYFTDPPKLPKMRLSNPKRKGHGVQSKLHIRKQVQKCILRHDWASAVSLMNVLISENPTKDQLPFILETLHTLVENHPSSSRQQLEDFEIATSSLMSFSSTALGDTDSEDDN